MRRCPLAVALLGLLARAATAAVVPGLGPGLRPVEYLPLGFQPAPVWRPSAAGLRADAASLVALGVQAAIVPATVPAACRFLRRHGVPAVLVAVEPRPGEAARTGRRHARCAAGFVVAADASPAAGAAAVEATLAGLRRATSRLAGLRASAETVLADPALARTADFVLAVVDPWATPARGAQEACGDAMLAFRDLERALPGVPLALVAGRTTVDEPAGEHLQRAYLACLESRSIPIVVREAFDQPWRGGAAAHGGIFRADGTPKRWALQVRRPAFTVERDAAGVRGRVAGFARGRVVVWGRDGERWRRLALVAPRPDGAWRARVASAGAVAAQLVAAETPPADATVARLPPVDDVAVFATAERP